MTYSLAISKEQSQRAASGAGSNAIRRGVRYEVVGTATDEREVAVICRLKETGKLLFITTYALE